MLQFDGVTFGYGPRREPAAREITLGVDRGGITAVLGPNGAGKSTLLFLALGWLVPRQGTIRLDGRPLASYSRRDMGRLMGLVPQREHIAFEYSVVEYVLLGRIPHLPPLAQPREEDYEAALSALEEVGLTEFADRSVFRLSGGERQLVLIARSLAQRPALLLLDEPTSHLDLHNKFRLLSLLKRLRDRGATIWMTTHEPELASALASKVILMNEGQVFFSGPPEEALTSEHLSRLYRLQVEVASVAGRKVVLW